MNDLFDAVRHSDVGLLSIGSCQVRVVFEELELFTISFVVRGCGVGDGSNVSVLDQAVMNFTLELLEFFGGVSHEDEGIRPGCRSDWRNLIVRFVVLG